MKALRIATVVAVLSMAVVACGDAFLASPVALCSAAQRLESALRVDVTGMAIDNLP